MFIISGAYGESFGATVGITFAIQSRIVSTDSCACVNASRKTSIERPFIFISSCIAVIHFFVRPTLKSMSPRKSSCA